MLCTERSMKKYLQNDYKNPTYATGAFMRIFERPKDQSDENVLVQITIFK